MRVMRVVVAVLAVVALVGLGAPAASGADGEADLAAARQRADEAASALAAAQTRLAELEMELAALEARAAETEARVVELSSAVRTMAIEQFVSGGERQLAVVLDADPGRSARASALARFVTASNVDLVDHLRAAEEDLSGARDALGAVRRRSAAAVADLRSEVAAVNAELQRLEALEAERRAREAAERRRREQESARRAAAARDARRSVPARAAAPSPSQGSPAGGDGWVCPVQGPRAFTNDWGQPRSGGRRHQGTDILSPRGTPVVANVSGVVRPHQSSLGGISYYLAGDDGTTYFGTHLDSLSGVSGRVASGTVIGYVGDSGNARGGPTHLHFEMHPGGGAAVNPYPTLRQHC